MMESGAAISKTLWKVLLLHAHGMTGDAFYQRTGSIRGELKKYCSFATMDAPILVQPASENPATIPSSTANERARSPPLPCMSGGRSWYDFSHYTCDPDSKVKTYQYEGVEEALDAVAAFCQSNGPFDGIMAFSQGCVIATLWLARLQREPQRLPPCMQGIKFCVLVSGLLPHDPKYRAYIEAARPIPVASLHCFGTTDAIVPNHLTQQLASVYEPAMMQQASHDGGHVVASVLRKPIRDFIISVMERSSAAGK